VSGQNPREIAVEVLQHRGEGDFVEDLLEAELGRSHLSSADRGLCQELVYGIVRWKATLDWLFSRKTDNRVQKPLMQNLLRLGLYQIFWLDRIPNHAAVHETVEIARRRGLSAQSGFVNAILRGFLREFDQTKLLLAELKKSHPALGHSHPDWIVERWQRRWGNDKAAQLMAWNNTPARMCARVNTLKVEPGKLLEQWRDENVEYDFVSRDWLDQNLVFELKAHPPVAHLPSFQQGLFYIQDPGTLLASRELDPKPGETILDLCAAPGGKLTHIAQLMQNQGRLIAHDLNPERLKLIEENCTRLGITCVRTALHSEIKRERFDRILIDAPCSNTGVMRRRVELRWRIRPEEIERLSVSQLSLLREAAHLLKPGGTLVYSTCSLEPEENDAVVDEFMAGQSNLKLENKRELTPFADGVDGGYVARLASSGATEGRQPR
jgi:16S rRNA (cytosine967-C5)-methyltransferase